MNLIYYTIGGNPEYAKLLRYSCQTVRERCDLHDTKIVAFCDESYEDIISDIRELDDIYIVPPNKDKVQVSMRKVEVFSYPQIWDFEKSLYLDCDTVILKDLCSDIIPLFTDPSKLYVYAEQKNIDSHNHIFWGLNNYTESEIEKFRALDQRVFNCGHFGFKVNTQMQRHFENVICEMKTYKGAFFYEQSFVNKYFNSNLLTDPLLTKYIHIPMYDGSEDQSPCKDSPNDRYVVHFADINIPFLEKLRMMQNAYNRK